MSSQDTINLCEKKNQIQDLLQGVFNEYNRMNEVRIQNNCEKDLEMRGMNDTIRSLETSEKEKIDEIRNLKKVICDYETMINDLNSKFESLEEDKKEENRFDMIRIQANEISEKDREIERLNGLLKHYKKKDNKDGCDNTEKINTVLNKVESRNVSEITLTEVDEAVDEKTGESNPNFIYDDKTTEQPEEEQKAEQPEEEQNAEQPEEEQKAEQEDEQPEEENEEQEVDKGNLIIVTSKKIKYYAYENEVPQTVYEFNGKKLAEKPLGTRMKNEKGKYRVQLFAS